VRRCCQGLGAGRAQKVLRQVEADQSSKKWGRGEGRGPGIAHPGAVEVEALQPMRTLPAEADAVLVFADLINYAFLSAW
jgi:hypothetical protein